MNERIRLLAEQVYGSAHYDDFKFAELIVHECAHAVAQHNALSYQQSVPFNVSQVLNNHFGIDK
jgi:hypothetical protein